LNSKAFQSDLKTIASENADKLLNDKLGEESQVKSLKFDMMNPRSSLEENHEIFWQMRASINEDKDFSSEYPPNILGDYHAVFQIYFHYFCEEYNSRLEADQVHATNFIVDEMADCFSHRLPRFESDMAQAISKDQKNEMKKMMASEKWELSLDVLRYMLQELKDCSKTYPLYRITFWENRGLQTIFSDVGDIIAKLVHAETDSETLMDLVDDLHWIILDNDYATNDTRAYLTLEILGAVGSCPLAPVWFLENDPFFMDLCAEQLRYAAEAMNKIISNIPAFYKGESIREFYATKMGDMVKKFVEKYGIEKDPGELGLNDENVGANFTNDIRRIFHWRKNIAASQKNVSTAAIQTLLHALVGRLTESIVMEIPDALPFLFA